MEPQQGAAGFVGAFDGGLLPIARREQQQVCGAGRGFQFEHIDRHPAVLADERRSLPGTGLDHAGRQELAAGHRLAHRVPLARGPLRRIGGPRLEHTGRQVGAPLRRP
ncbi:hypothetical protein [Streptomyces sp. NPDC050564]|uniref:hypothetical protein n=1 Tax=Streptomyces sp. NPDC050564 TaxID=3365631 RepID=UPI0037B394F1